MRRTKLMMSTAVIAGAAIVSCQGQNKDGGLADGDGSITLSLAQAPAGAACLQVTVDGYRKVVKSFPLTAGEATEYRLSGLPTGLALVSGAAFGVACGAVNAGVDPAWLSDQPVAVKIDTAVAAHVLLRLIRNGRISIGVDFEGMGGGPGTIPPPAGGGSCTGGFTSSQSPFLLPAAPGVMTKALFTVGDTANLKPNMTPYRMVGLLDGLGAFDNGDGTFTVLANHEVGGTAGIARAHGGKGAFVSKWTIRKCDLAVLKGEDLINTVQLWDAATSAYVTPATPPVFSRFCSADLPAGTAFYDAATGLGTEGRLFMNGEESGNEGRAMAHAMDGSSWELPRLGKMSWENAVPSPNPGVKTVVVGLDDSTPGQVYVYVGNKTASGSVVDRAGLTNGNLYGVRVVGFANEDTAAGIPSGSAFDLAPFGNVENTTGTALDTASNAAGVTRFMRPEDGAWDPNSPNDFYFVTTASFTTPSRLWRLRFIDAQNPTLGGKIDLLLDGSEGQHMFDNIGLDRFGHVYLQEDVGNQAHNGKTWRYDIASDSLTVIVEHDPARFISGGAQFLTQDEESSGIIDVSDILGDGWFLVADQAHVSNMDSELIESGQLLLLFDPAARKP